MEEYEKLLLEAQQRRQEKIAKAKGRFKANEIDRDAFKFSKTEAKDAFKNSKAILKDQMPKEAMMTNMKNAGQIGMAGLGILNSAVQANEANRPEGSPKSIGAAMLNGGMTGLSLGAATGNPIVAGAGAVVGAGVAAINNSNERKEYEREIRQYEAAKNHKESLYGKGLVDSMKAEAYSRYVG